MIKTWTVFFQWLDDSPGDLGHLIVEASQSQLGRLKWLLTRVCSVVVICMYIKTDNGILNVH